METYFKIRTFLEFGLLGILIVSIIVYIAYCAIKDWHNKTFKKNCFKCKHYKLHGTYSFGDGAMYKCSKFDRIDNLHHNVRYNYIKCKTFEEE